MSFSPSLSLRQPMSMSPLCQCHPSSGFPPHHPHHPDIITPIMWLSPRVNVNVCVSVTGPSCGFARDNLSGLARHGACGGLERHTGSVCIYNKEVGDGPPRHPGQFYQYGYIFHQSGQKGLILPKWVNLYQNEWIFTKNDERQFSVSAKNHKFWRSNFPEEIAPIYAHFVLFDIASFKSLWKLLEEEILVLMEDLC